MAKAASLVSHEAELLPARRVQLINPLVYCNMDLMADDRFRRRLHWYNAARDHDQPAVWLGKYDPDTTLSGDSPFALLTRGVLVDEQTPPDEFAQAVIASRLASGRHAAMTLDRPCLLACRRGEGTWGHWLVDMLPKIVLAEMAFPQQFTFVVPGAITQQTPGHAGSVMQSLAAYGINASRLLRVMAGQTYRLGNLFDVIDIMRDGMHPGAIAAMQTRIDVSAGPRRSLTAVLRGDAEHRRIVNAAEINDVLSRAGAAHLDPATATFAEQVRAFRDSEAIVGDLGSNLAAAIYARPDTGIVTLAPSGWDDAFFVHSFQRQMIRHADVRGVAVPRDTRAIGHATYLVDAGHFTEGMRAVLDPERAALPTAAGRLIARAPGLPILQIRFGIGGNAAPFQAGGFDQPEEDFTWSLGPSCTLRIADFAPPPGDCWLEVCGVGYTVAPHLVSRPLSISINGAVHATFDIDDLTRVHVPLPRQAMGTGGGLDIVFHHPVCPSPLAMGTGDDTRALGFRFGAVAVRPA